MAVIGRIRKQSTLLLIIIGVALAAFVLGDLFKKGPSRQAANIGEINGEKIHIRDFNMQYEENVEFTKAQQQKEQLTQEDAFFVRENTWNQIIRGILTTEEYEKVGIQVSADELYDQIQGLTPHRFVAQQFRNPQTGQFDRAMLENYLQNLDQMPASAYDQWVRFEKAVKDDRADTKFNNLIAKGYYVPALMAKNEFNTKNEKASCRLIGKKYQEVADDQITVTDADYEKFYEDHKNEYEQLAAREIDYIVFDVRPSQDDRQKASTDIQEVYQEFRDAADVALFVNATSDTRIDSSWKMAGQLPARIDSIMFHSKVGTMFGPYLENESYHIAKLTDVQMRPDSIKASHILLAYQGAMRANEVTRSREEAQALADSLFNVTKKSSRKFDALAKQYSDGPSSTKGGDLGWFADGSMVNNFNEACVHGKKDEIKMVETPFGFHVIKITGKRKAVKKVRVAMINRSIDPSNQTYQNVYRRADEFAGEFTNAELFDKMSDSLGLNRRRAPRLYENTNRIAGLSNPREIVRWAFSENTTVGLTSQVFDLEGKYVVACLKEKFDKGISTLEQVKNRIEPLVKREKKAEIIKKEMMEAMKGAKDIDAIAAKMKLDVQDFETNLAGFNVPMFGRETGLIGHIFSQKEGQLSQPFQGNMAVYVVVVEKVSKAMETTDYAADKRIIENAFSGNASRRAFEVLKEKAEITDNRILFY